MRLLAVCGAILGIWLGLATTGWVKPATAKELTTELWLVGGDLPHPVKIPTEQLANPGTRQGEAFEIHLHTSAEQLGVGYDLLSGSDLNTALHTLHLDESYETFFPGTIGPNIVEVWQPTSTEYSSRPEDRRATNWETVSGGLYALLPRYIALAKAGSIGEQPTFSQALAATVRMTGVRAFLNGATNGGVELSDAASAAVVNMLPPIVQTTLSVPGQTLRGPFYGFQLRFGAGSDAGGLVYIYTPPNTRTGVGLLFPQAGTTPTSDGAGAMIPAYQTRPAFDAILAHYRPTNDVVGPLSAITLGPLGTGGRAAAAIGGHNPELFLLIALGLASALAAGCLALWMYLLSATCVSLQYDVYVRNPVPRKYGG
jgi:hypothetical protein